MRPDRFGTGKAYLKPRRNSGKFYTPGKPKPKAAPPKPIFNKPRPM